MAVREFISWNSSPVLITNWGAHQDILKEFKGTNRVFSLNLTSYKSCINISPFTIARSLKKLQECPSLILGSVNKQAQYFNFKENNIHAKNPIEKESFLKLLSQNEETQNTVFNSFYASDVRELNPKQESFYLHPLITFKDNKVFFNGKALFDLKDSDDQECVKVKSLNKDISYNLPIRCFERLFRFNLLFPSA